MIPAALDDNFVRQLILEPQLIAVVADLVAPETLRGDDHQFFLDWLLTHYRFGFDPADVLQPCMPWLGMREWIVGQREAAHRTRVPETMRVRDEHGTPLMVKAVAQRLLAREGEELVSTAMTAETGFDPRVFAHRAIVAGRRAVAAKLERIVGAAS